MEKGLRFHQLGFEGHPQVISYGISAYSYLSIITDNIDARNRGLSICNSFIDGLLESQFETRNPRLSLLNHAEQSMLLFLHLQVP